MNVFSLKISKVCNFANLNQMLIIQYILKIELSVKNLVLQDRRKLFYGKGD